jgi:hypothetical protein
MWRKPGKAGKIAKKMWREKSKDVAEDIKLTGPTLRYLETLRYAY